MFESFEGGRIIAFVVTIVAAQMIAMTLFRMSGRSSRAAAQQATKVPQKEPLAQAASGDNALVPLILREMKDLSVPAANRQRMATALSALLNQQLEKKVGAMAQELSRKYEQAVQEKTKEATVIRQQYQQTLAQKEQTEAVMRSLAEGLVVVNMKGDVVFLNPAAEKLLGVDKREKLGKPLTEGLKDEQLLSLVKGGSGSQNGLEVELSASQDQTKRIVRSSNAVIEDENGKTIGMVSVLTDITKQRELDRLKSEFVSGVTHEIRTPIVAMQHSLAVMQEEAAGNLSDPQKNFLNIAQRNLERLNGMINDLLDLAKLEAHKLTLKPQRAPIGPVVQHASETFEAWAQSKGIHLTCRVPEGLPEAVLDPARIEQVLVNLIGNALKFTPAEGTVTMEAKFLDDKTELEVSVTDTGAGIAKEDIPKLFKKFQQVGNRIPGEVHGTGLGLAIAKELVELHHGTIWVESEKGHGARFAFTLPLTQPQPVKEVT